MEKFTEIISGVITVLIVISFWYLIRRIVKTYSNRVNDTEEYKQNLITVLEEIRDELKISNNSKNKNTNESF
jgi:hypothetical protein